MSKRINLRKGTDHTGVCVVYFCHDGKGNVLMAKRSSKTRDEHRLWDIGGGAVEFDADVIETIHKEIKEEYCTDVLKCEFLGYRDVHRINKRRKTHWIALDFKVLVDRKKVKNGEPEKFDEIAWFAEDKIPKDIHSQLPKFLKLYKSKLY